MLSRMDTWILLGIVVWLSACGLIALLDSRKDRLRDMSVELVETRLERDEMRRERDTVMQRYEATRDHYCLIRDEEIDRLKGEVAAWEKKYRILESAVNQMWPKEVKQGHDKETLPTGV